MDHSVRLCAPNLLVQETQMMWTERYAYCQCMDKQLDAKCT